MASYFPPTESTADLVSDDQAHEAFARAVKTTSSRTEHDSAVALFFDWDFDGLSSMAPLKDLQDVFATQYHWNHEHTILKSYRPDGQENEQKALSEHSRNTRAAVQFVEKLETARHTYDSDTNLLLIVFRCRGRVRTTHYKEKELYLWYVPDLVKTKQSLTLYKLWRMEGISKRRWLCRYIDTIAFREGRPRSSSIMEVEYRTGLGLLLCLYRTVEQQILLDSRVLRKANSSKRSSRSNCQPHGDFLRSSRQEELYLDVTTLGYPAHKRKSRRLRTFSYSPLEP